MDWIRQSYERVVLMGATAILLLSGLAILREATGFRDQFALQTRAPQKPATPPGKAAEVESALHHLAQAPQWTFSGRSGLFVPEKHFIGPDGQLATLQNTEVHSPVPNDWFEQYGLPIAENDVLDQDPDGDGFSNLDEWQGHTNPIEGASHPDYVTKLKLKTSHQEPFPFLFASRTGNTFGINSVDLSQPTQFVRMGDTLAGTRFRVAGFEQKYANSNGIRVDVSELKLQHLDTGEQLTLVKEQVAISPSSVATFVYSWKERREFSVKKDQEFSLPPRTEIKYKLVDVQSDKAVISSSEKPGASISIGLLAP